MPPLYSLDRVRRLRLVLGVGVLAGVLLVLLGIFIGLGDDDLHRFAAVIGVAGVLVLLQSGLSLRALPGRDRTAKVMAAVTGALTLLVGLLFLTMILGLAMLVLGIAILVLALLPDDPDIVS